MAMPVEPGLDFPWRSATTARPRASSTWPAACWISGCGIVWQPTGQNVPDRYRKAALAAKDTGVRLGVTARAGDRLLVDGLHGRRRNH
jgi:hypothetical protein